MERVLVAGSEGLIGRELVYLLNRDDNIVVLKADIKLGHDLRNFKLCEMLCRKIDRIFMLCGIKGNPAKCKNKPADFLVPMTQFNFNMMEAARLCGVKRYLYTSSIGVYHPAEILKEDDVWKTFPSENDRFAGWA